MYFYVLEGGSFEEYWKTIYFSETLYTEKEFKQILLDAYQHACNKVISEEHWKPCFSSELRVESIFWAWGDEWYDYCTNDFNKYIRAHSDLIPIENTKVQVKVSVGTCITPNANTLFFEDSIDVKDYADCHDDCIYDIEDKPHWHKLHCVYDDIRADAERLCDKEIEDDKKKRQMQKSDLDE